MNKIIKYTSLITLCTALGLPLASYAACAKSLNITIDNQSSHELTLTGTTEYCSCAQNSDSMTSKYPVGSKLAPKQQWQGYIYVDTSSPFYTCYTSPTTYNAEFSDANNSKPVIHYQYLETGGSVSYYDNINPINNGVNIYTTNPGDTRACNGNINTTCTLTATINDK